MFDYRFRQEETKVVSCNTFRKTENVQKHWRKVKKYRAQVEDYNTESYVSGNTSMIWVGSNAKCNRRQVDALKYYQDKLESAMADWEVTKKIFETENQGVVILVFKTKSCAEQVYEEMVKMLGSQRLL